jgi:hypothetical protein
MATLSKTKPKPAIGTAFYHPRVQSIRELEHLAGCPLGIKSPDSLQPAELEERPTRIIFDNRGDGLFRSGNVKDYVFFELAPEFYDALPVDGNIYWVVCRDEGLLAGFIERLKGIDRTLAPDFFGVMLGDFLRNLVWNDNLTEEERERAYLRAVHATLEGQRNISNVTDIELATGLETGIFREGVVALLSNHLRLKARELHLKCSMGKIRTDVLIDGGGRFRVGAYRNLQHLLPFARIVSIIASQGLLKAVDEPAQWQEFYIEGWIGR